MPDHMHGIVVIDKKNDESVETRHCLVSENIGQNRFQNQGKKTLSSIIGSYKSIVTKHARQINPDFTWQSSFYDHIIRDDYSYQKVREYIINNPLHWKQGNL